MPLSDHYHRIPLDEIRILRDERQRREIVTDDLESSIARRGVISPIIIQRDGTLIAGERRVEASRKLGLPDIPARYADELSPLEAQIIELEENIKRKDLTWQDHTRALQRIHSLYTDLAAAEGTEWSQLRTAEEIGLTAGTVSVYLRVAPEMGDDRISGAATVREAYGMLERRQQRLNGETLDQLFGQPQRASAADPSVAPPLYVRPETLNGGPPLVEPRPLEEGPPPPERTILQRDFTDWASTYSGPKFNLIHCDFPYGIGAFAGPQMTNHTVYRGGKFIRQGSDEDNPQYDDERASFDKLFNAFCSNLDRFASHSCHLMFWYTADSILLYELLTRFAEQAPSWRFYKFPLIWFKSDNAGVIQDHRRTPRHTYEVALLASRGDRQIASVVADSYSAPTDNKLHPSAKPEPVLRHFFRMLADETTVMLDPTCGAGSSIRAAESLGVKSALGLELNEQFVLAGQRELRASRLKRAAERLLARSKPQQPAGEPSAPPAAS